MWILQAKVFSPYWTTKGSSLKEIELYEKVPEFELFASAHANAPSLGTFELQKDFHRANIMTSRFWNYLFFEPTQVSPAISLVRSHWSAHSQQWQSSFVGALGLIASPHSVLRTDTVVLPSSHPEWTRLYNALWLYAGKRAPSKLPGGPWIHTALNQPSHDPGGGVLAYEIAFPDSEMTFATTGFGDPKIGTDEVIEHVGKFTKRIDEPGPNKSDWYLKKYAERIDHIDQPPPSNPDSEGGGGEDGGPGIKMLVIDQRFSGDSQDFQ